MGLRHADGRPVCRIAREGGDRVPGGDYKDDPPMGEKFSFDLAILEWVAPSDSKDATEPHGPHTDTYSALLSDTEPKLPATGMLSYNFGVEGRHTEFFNSPQDTPEPATWLLAGAALLLPGSCLAKRCRAAAIL